MSISQVESTPKAQMPDSSTTDFQPSPAAPSPSLETSPTSPPLPTVLQNVTAAIAPVWPLRDFVAVNPYMGHSDRTFLKARQLLRSVCDCDTLMPLAYYQQRFEAHAFGASDIETAVAEINDEDYLSRLTTADVMQALKSNAAPRSSKNERRMRTMVEHVDKKHGTTWSETVLEEIGRHCAAFYDEGQAVWGNPFKNQPLFQAWRSAAQMDRRLELSGVSGCCRFFASLPDCPKAAVDFLLQEVGMPAELWEPFLLCQAHSVPGWSAWTRYKTDHSENDKTGTDFIALLAIRLAYDVAVAKAAAIRVDQNTMAKAWDISDRSIGAFSAHDARVRFALLRASEVAFQRQLLSSLAETPTPDDAPSTTHTQPLAQMVFCIDVRSERYRRHLEGAAQSTAEVQTFGFAGFFGMPIAFQNFCEQTAAPQVPALLSPSFVVQEGVRDASDNQIAAMHKRRGLKRLFKNSWKHFQSSAAGCFGFVETSGMAYGWKLLSKSLNRRPTNPTPKFDGVAASSAGKLAPLLTQLDQQGIDLTKQIDLAESALRGIGITTNFARLVVFCGHGSQVQNNPLQAGLDCGACCGHSGEPNARFAAVLLNQIAVRNGLVERGITVPQDTRFVAALHNTTSDEVTFFDTDLLTDSQQTALTELTQFTTAATGHTQLERLPQLKADNGADVLQRTLDWSEVRPEWGLSGNAAFIVAPRQVTQDANLDGRSFLHSYDYNHDDGFQVLEQIMTAPMVVGHWINMQYYASTLDNNHYGSGSKTIHNVVGKFGIFSGNGGDLTTGLPWQSVHDGQNYQHEPLRLLAVIAAPKTAVAEIINRHKLLHELLTNGWLNLTVLEDGEFHRYTTRQAWQPLSSSNSAIGGPASRGH